MVFRPQFRRLLAESAHVPKALQLIWAAAGRWTALWAGLLVVQGLLPLAVVLLSRSLVDRIVAAVAAKGDWSAVQPVIAAGTALAIVLLVDQILTSCGRWLATVQIDQIHDYVASLIQAKSIEVDLAFYESADFYDHLHRARDESGNQTVQLLDSLGNIARGTLTLLAMVGVLLPYGPWLALALLASTVPAVYVVARHTRLEHHWWLERTEAVRRSGYYDWMLVTGVNAAEIRLFGLGERFRSAYRDVRERLRAERRSRIRGRVLAEARVGVVALAINGIAGLWMIWRTVQGALTLGDLVLAYQAFQQGQGLIRGLLGNVSQLYSTVLFLGSLFDFLSLRPEIASPVMPAPMPVPLRTGIRFEKVTFRYPRSDRTTLVDLDLEIPAGQIVAILGANGAGKSTLVKLLCRFYDPQAGRITVDGIDLRQFDVESLRRSISAIFQTPIRYATTAAENIAFGDIERPADPSRISAAAAAAGAHETIHRLPDGYATELGTLFAGGTDLSVGEWQRVALARAVLREAPIWLLDEPTSATDSWAEAEWLDRLRSLAHGRTTLIITHRLSTAMRAHAIHVMAEGRIVESGSHDELIARRGHYAASWAAQRQG